MLATTGLLAFPSPVLLPNFRHDFKGGGRGARGQRCRQFLRAVVVLCMLRHDWLVFPIPSHWHRRRFFLFFCRRRRRFCCCRFCGRQGPKGTRRARREGKVGGGACDVPCLRPLSSGFVQPSRGPHTQAAAHHDWSSTLIAAAAVGLVVVDSVSSGGLVQPLRGGRGGGSDGGHQGRGKDAYAQGAQRERGRGRWRRRSRAGRGAPVVCPRGGERANGEELR
mmetsp:Transcript_65898/g.132687  ORF Transcript_65898/g.132687 Transcript_65898/m.132687 type:complete len:222 (+) Transcript_65898:192-857(+)